MKGKYYLSDRALLLTSVYFNTRVSTKQTIQKTIIKSTGVLINNLNISRKNFRHKG